MHAAVAELPGLADLREELVRVATRVEWEQPCGDLNLGALRERLDAVRDLVPSDARVTAADAKLRDKRATCEQRAISAPVIF